jgi:HK97 family phage major capsid protein
MNEKRIKALTEKRNAIIEQMESMTAAAIDDNGEERAFTEEEQARFNELEASAKALKNTIEAEERARELELKPAEDKKPEEKKEMNEELRAQAEERAFADFLRGVVSEERADLTVANGQATIPTSIANKIITKVWDICPIAARATRYNVKGTLTIPFYPATELGGTPDIAMDYADEFTELTSSTGKFSSITLQAFLAGVLTKVSKSLVNNSQFDIVGFVIDHMAENIARWLEKECLVGTQNKIAGLSTVSLTQTAAAANAVTADELIKVQGKVKDAFQANACWIMSPATREAIRTLKDGEERYLLNPDYREEFGYKLLGKPVFVSDNMPDMATGKTAIYYGDLSGLALKISEDLNIEVLREKFATEHAIGVVGYMECDAKIENEQKIAALVMA